MANDKWNSESRMRENRPSGLMRGGSQTVIGCKPSHPVGSCLLYTSELLGYFFGFAFFTADFLAPLFALLLPLPMSALAAR